MAAIKTQLRQYRVTTIPRLAQSPSGQGMAAGRVAQEAVGTMTTITLDEYHQMTRKKHKYNARKTVLNGLEFDSKKESDRYQELLLLEASGRIVGLSTQPEFVLLEGFRDRRGKWRRAIKYRADFIYKEDDAFIVEDVKGIITKEFAIKMKLFLYHYPGYDLRIVK